MIAGRKTLAVNHGHDLGHFPDHQGSKVRTPLNAPVKVASIKHYERSNFPRFRRSSARGLRIAPMTPSLTHFWRYRLQICYGRNCGRRTAQVASVRLIQRIPISTSQGWCIGLPRLTGVMDFGIKDLSRSHCSSLMSAMSGLF